MGVYALEILFSSNVEICGVVVRDDDPSPGMWYKSVTELAQKNGLLILKPKNINSPDFVNIIKDINPDLLLTAFYPQIYKAPLLQVAKYGSLNLHFAPLPKYRGSFPGAWAIINNEREHGVSIHYMRSGVDNGPIAFQKIVTIDSLETGHSLYKKCEEAGKSLLAKHLSEIISGEIASTPQDEKKAIYYPRGQPYGGVINWGWDSIFIERYIRALTFPPFKNPNTFVGNRKLFLEKISIINTDQTGHLPGTVLGKTPLQIQCGSGVIKIEKFHYSGNCVDAKNHPKKLQILGI